MHRTLLLLTLLIGLILIGGSGAATDVLRPSRTAIQCDPEGEKIVFYSDRDGNAEIYVMNADGSDPQRLTFNDADDSSPVWSPPGDQVAFISARNDENPQTCFPRCNYDLYVIDVDGDNEIQLTDAPSAEYHPDWSPDGAFILFDADRDGDGLDEIYKITPDGSELERLTQNAANDHWADWSPDGTQIVFISDRDEKQEIYIMDADSSNQQRLTDNDLNEFFPAWSPDGTQIAFMTVNNRRIRELYVLLLDTDEDDMEELIDLGVRGEDPAWSPDGEQIVYQTDTDGDFEIFVVDADGNDPKQLTQNRYGDFWPDWLSEMPSSPR
jgi:TolB protein